MILISIILIVLTIWILHSTEVTTYVRLNYTKCKKIETKRAKLRLWYVLLIILVYSIPYVNIVMFVVFIGSYIVKSKISKDKLDKYDYKVSIIKDSILYTILNFFKDVFTIEL